MCKRLVTAHEAICEAEDTASRLPFLARRYFATVDNIGLKLPKDLARKFDGSWLDMGDYPADFAQYALPATSNELFWER